MKTADNIALENAIYLWFIQQRRLYILLSGEMIYEKALFFHRQMTKDLKGNHYTSDDEVKATIASWFREKSEEFFSDGMKKLVTCWEKCVRLNGDYVEK
ncbi:hypothetical protein J437_LFUL013290 [Ladona fulva]|uniref:HTH CENPB-type domain-containing protein n=1 Tax=Ladona fulva TaxID=123851 RepID=A0A8K0KF69_LADFU|nr:hypothetical protein J437_LFUL013290 [Ladona fulva]